MQPSKLYKQLTMTHPVFYRARGFQSLVIDFWETVSMRNGGATSSLDLKHLPLLCLSEIKIILREDNRCPLMSDSDIRLMSDTESSALLQNISGKWNPYKLSRSCSWPQRFSVILRANGSISVNQASFVHATGTSIFETGRLQGACFATHFACSVGIWVYMG